ncbi:hypothetical protein [Acetivibrio ethanolgignens]|uniref:HipA-like C-terminal domain-containing protein n=1 Tax=Acetivibrio ethanolgignens TaxID=290052 RepID=A0A0V8QEX6_9FIRM|nr:hypothetical protein [Acetivibrio ethanolgignens]KSV59141.1 hypothetical protein ASU35_10300 [Acetivibrio ethanolgignens]
MEVMNIFEQEVAYSIRLKDKEAAVVYRNSGRVEITHRELMPYGLYLEEGDDFDTRVNNKENFNYWCSTRLLTLDRRYAKELLNSCGLQQARTDKERASIALQYYCLTLTDFYWVVPINEVRDWNSVSLHRNSLSNAVVDLALKGSPTVTNLHLITSDLSTSGIAPKAWYRENGKFYLYKGDEDAVTKEVEASQILQRLGFNVVDYSYRNYDNELVACSECFTNDNTAMVTAEEFNVWAMNEGRGLKEELRKWEVEYHLMNLADYLVGNSDRHSGNWGLLFNEDRMITSFAPLMDFNHAFESADDTLCLPALMLGEHKTQYEAAVEALQFIDKRKLNIITELKYSDFVNERIRRIR